MFEEITFFEGVIAFLAGCGLYHVYDALMRWRSR
jgi:hypothetical protein